MSDPVRLSVVIVNWNGREITLECLRALEGQTDPDFETIVVDNGSTDGSAEAIRRAHPRVRVVEAGENLGFAEGNNRGIAVATGTWIATLNNDTIAHERWIAELRAAAEGAGPRVGMLQSRVLFMSEPATTASTGVVLFSNGRAEDRDVHAPGDALAAEDVFCPTAGAALYRRAMLDETRLETGYFDRTFFMYFEDVDLGWRCRLAGWSAKYVPGAVVRHIGHASTEKQAGNFLGLHLFRNQLRMMLKNGSIRFIARSMPQSFYDVCEALVWEGPGIVPSFGRAILDGARQRAKVKRLARERRRAVETQWVSASTHSVAREMAKQIEKAIRRARQ